jgi:hypothetical protein
MLSTISTQAKPAELRVGALLDRAITLVVQTFPAVGMIALVSTLLKFCSHLIFPRENTIRDDAIYAGLDILIVPAFYAALAGRATTAGSALRWGLQRIRTVSQWTILYWIVFGIPNELLDAAIEHTLGRAALLPVLALSDIVLAPLTIALAVSYCEAVLEGQPLRSAFHIGWMRGVGSDVRRAWLYGSVISLTILVFALVGGMIGGFLDVIAHQHLMFFHLLFEAAYSIATAVGAAFAISLADALRVRYAGADLELAVDASA